MGRGRASDHGHHGGPGRVPADLPDVPDVLVERSRRCRSTGCSAEMVSSSAGPRQRQLHWSLQPHWGPASCWQHGRLPVVPTQRCSANDRSSQKIRGVHEALRERGGVAAADGERPLDGPSEAHPRHHERERRRWARSAATRDAPASSSGFMKLNANPSRTSTTVSTTESAVESVQRAAVGGPASPRVSGESLESPSAPSERVALRRTATTSARRAASCDGPPARLLLEAPGRLHCGGSNRSSHQPRPN